MILYIIWKQNKKIGINIVDGIVRQNIYIISFLCYTSFCFITVADTLIAQGKTYQDVYIMEGLHSYYILLPETGDIESVLKKDIDNKTVIFDEPEKRMALKKQWDEKQSVSAKLSDKEKKILANKVHEENHLQSTSKPSAFVLKHKGNASQNYIPNRNYYSSKGDMPHTMPGTLYNSNMYQTRINSKSLGFYNAQNTDSLPRVVLRNPPVSGMGYLSGGNIMNYGANAFPGGWMGRMPVGYGGGMGMYNDVTVISNISDLFSTIDDHLVGEFGPIKLIPSSVALSNNRQ